uniref:Uncharacterized protein n=1 Tax=viral metagenome TaxID=1070528 RepID=A0A6C0CA22_9ZZZZ
MDQIVIFSNLLANSVHTIMLEMLIQNVGRDVASVILQFVVSTMEVQMRNKIIIEKLVYNTRNVKSYLETFDLRDLAFHIVDLKYRIIGGVDWEIVPMNYYVERKYDNSRECSNILYEERNKDRTR